MKMNADYKVEYLFKKYSFNDIVSKIDHTLLKPYATIENLKRTCFEAIEYNFYGCCVSPCYLKYASEYLSGSNVKLMTVVGFPLGFQPIDVKLNEIECYLKWNIEEVDIVMNIGLLKSGRYDELKNELSELVQYSHDHGLVTKIIIETSLLTEDEIIKVAKIVLDSSSDFIKTNTGFGSRGVNFNDIMLIKQAVGNKLKIKAAGGIREILDFLMFLELGVDRIGTSSGVKIVKEYNKYKHLLLG